MTNTFGIIVIVAYQDNSKLLCTTRNQCKISQVITLSIKLSVTFNGVNLQRGNVFTLVFVIYVAIEMIAIMSSIIEILKILLYCIVLDTSGEFCRRMKPSSLQKSASRCNCSWYASVLKKVRRFFCHTLHYIQKAYIGTAKHKICPQLFNHSTYY